MALAWFISPYARDLTARHPTRYCAMQAANSVIRLNDGDWTETEVGNPAVPAVGGAGGLCIVRVRGSPAILADLATVYRRLPKDALTDPLSDLTNPQRTAILDWLNECGYTTPEIRAALGNDIRIKTLGDVLRFAASRRFKPRYDATNDRIICDGIVQSCREILDVERRCFSDTDWTRLLGFRDALLGEWDANRQLIQLSQRLPTLSKWERESLLILCGRVGYAFDKIAPNTFPTLTEGGLDNFNRADASTLGAAWTYPYAAGDSSPRIARSEERRV